MSAERKTPKRRANDSRGPREGFARTSNRVAVEATPSRRSRARSGTTSAPNRETRVPKSGPHTNPAGRPATRPAPPKNTSQAKARAKARKAKAPKVVRPKFSERLATRLASVDLRPSAVVSKVPFVVLVIAALGVGLALTLWLSTDAAERSYQLSHARERTRMLQQQKEALERDVREAESAPALAEAARKQGMIPTRDTAHLVQDQTGNWVVVGTPKPADGVAPPPLNTKLPEQGPPPPPKPPALPPEVPVRVLPNPDAPPSVRSGPEVLVRAPDGASTLGSTPLPPQAVPHSPGQVPAPGQAPMPGPGPVAAPGQTPGPVGTTVVPGDAPAPVQAGPVPHVVSPAVPPTPPGFASAPQPNGVPPVLALVPPAGEQFGPVANPIPTNAPPVPQGAP